LEGLLLPKSNAILTKQLKMFRNKHKYAYITFGDFDLYQNKLRFLQIVTDELLLNHQIGTVYRFLLSILN